MITVGITGGIGSGKSVVSELFRLQGIPVFDADSEAKRLNDTSPVIRKELTTLFGRISMQEVHSTANNWRPSCLLTGKRWRR